MMHKRHIVRALKIGIAVALIGLLLWKYPISADAVVATLMSVRVPLLLVVLLLLFNQFVISSIKWSAILRSHDIHLPLPSLVRSYMIGVFFSSFLPSSYMGDIVRIADVGRASGKPFESASAVVLERLSGLAALAAVGSVASFVIGDQFGESVFFGLGFLFTAITISLAAVFVPGVLELVQAVLRRVPVRLVRKGLDKVAGAVLHYRQRPRLLAWVVLWSFVFQLTAYAIFYLYGQTLGLPLPLLYCYAFVPVIYLLEALPITVAGFGLREGGLIYFLGKAGLTPSDAISLSILVVTCRYLLSLSGGVLFLSRGGRLSAAPAESARAPTADPAPQDRRPRRSLLGRVQRTLTRQVLPGFVATLYYFVRYRCVVHPKATVQLTRRFAFGRGTTIHPYTRIIAGETGTLVMGRDANLQSFSTIAVGEAAVRIGDNARIGPNCNLLASDHTFDDLATPIHQQDMVHKGLVIGEGAWVGANCILLPGVTVGRGAVVGAASVVTKDVPDFAIVVGNPARVIRFRGAASAGPRPEHHPVDSVA